MRAQMHNYSTWVNDTNPESLLKTYNAQLQEAGFEILRTVVHRFEPHGFTALFLLAESHFAIHTFPEESRTYIELTSCVKEPFEKFIQT